MSREARQYLATQALVGAVVNFVLNGAIAWLGYRSLASVPLSGAQSITGDLMVTGFALPLLVCLIVTPLVRSESRQGRVPSFAMSGPLSRFMGYLPGGTLARGLVLGVLFALSLAPATIASLHAIGIRGMGFWQFAGFKATFAAALAGLVTPVVAVRAAGEPSRS